MGSELILRQLNCARQGIHAAPRRLDQPQAATACATVIAVSPTVVRRMSRTWV
jgi:hypothetical protein